MEDWGKLERRAMEVRNKLRVYFGLQEDPIPFIKGTGYRTRFAVKCSQECSRSHYVAEEPGCNDAVGEIYRQDVERPPARGSRKPTHL